MITVGQFYVVIDALELKMDSPLVEAAGSLTAHFDAAEDRSTSMCSDFKFGDLTIIMAGSHELEADSIVIVAVNLARLSPIKDEPVLGQSQSWTGRLGVSRFMTAEIVFFHASPYCKDYLLTAERNLMCYIAIQLIGIFVYV
ncbi:hypothetical protein G6F37_006320 [Rhizopus arrhizus]|nr:hypothetical protein G6F38_009942 [Rhizopus arrhizus]KAG1157864.1 hypothetical protein G6F37_006320 [Rhizopus arrhizus]